MTKRLYFDNPYQTQCIAHVVSQKQTDKGWEIILDQTCFYSEGGGQASDTGTLNNIPVIELYKTSEGDIVHIVKQPLEERTVIEVKIDWDRRFRHMQQHSGQHVLSGALFNLFGLQTIQAKFDEHEGYILLERSLSDDEIAQVLFEANNIVFANKNIVTKFITLNEMDQYPLVKLPKEKFTKQGTLRIWHIDDFYTIPCGGTHVAKTGEIGLIFTPKQIKEGNLTKLFFTTGYLSLSYFLQVNTIAQTAAQTLQTSLKDCISVLTKKLDQNKHMEHQLEKQAKTVAQARAQELQQEKQHLGEYSVYSFTYKQEDQTLVKPILFQLAKSPKTIAIATSSTLPLTIAASSDMPKEIIATLKAILDKHHGKGGGNLVYWQAMLPNQKEFIKDFLAQLS